MRYLHYADRFLKLSFAQKIILCEFAINYLFFRYILFLLPHSLHKNWLLSATCDSNAKTRAGELKDISTLNEINRAVEIFNNLKIFQNCVSRAWAVRRILVRKDIFHQVCFSVSPIEGAGASRVFAHAWVESNGVIINGMPEETNINSQRMIQLLKFSLQEK
jgi:Transglutaminase-like superfamily